LSGGGSEQQGRTISGGIGQRRQGGASDGRMVIRFTSGVAAYDRLWIFCISGISASDDVRLADIAYGASVSIQVIRPLYEK